MNKVNLVFCSFYSKKNSIKILRFYLKASLSGLPNSSLTPELFDLSSTKRAKTGVQIAQVCNFYIMLLESLFLASYVFVTTNEAKTDVQIAQVFDQYLQLLCHGGHLKSLS